MPPSQFSEYLFSLYASRTEPPLSLIPLFGLSALTIPHLARYLNTTGDIQSVALISALIQPSTLRENERKTVKRWREGYRDLLDRWRLFGKRVEYDVLRLEVEGRFEDRERERERDVLKERECPVYVHINKVSQIDNRSGGVANAEY